MVKLFYIVPGATTAGDSIDLPSWVPPLRQIVGAIKITLSDGTATGAVNTLTVVDTTPSSGEIYLLDENTIQLGNDTTERDIIIIAAIEKGEYSGA